jgi:hypothetical protein
MPLDNKELEDALQAIWGGGIDYALSPDFADLTDDEKDALYIRYRDNLIDKAQALIADQCRLARIDELQLARSVDSQLSSADIVEHLENRKIELKKEMSNE